MADAASGELESSDRVCEIMDAPATFDSEVWKHFGFPLS